MLRVLNIKIDYRDALVDFSYHPKRWGHEGSSLDEAQGTPGQR
jgi:hypothetical protein